jgi:hypothetical protein
LEDVEQDVREKKIKKFRQKAVNKEKWASIFETKALGRPQDQGVNN